MSEEVSTLALKYFVFSSVSNCRIGRTIAHSPSCGCPRKTSGSPEQLGSNRKVSPRNLCDRRRMSRFQETRLP